MTPARPLRPPRTVMAAAPADARSAAALRAAALRHRRVTERAAAGHERVRQEFFPARPRLLAVPPPAAEHDQLRELRAQWQEVPGRTLAGLSGEVAALRRQVRPLQVTRGRDRPR